MPREKLRRSSGAKHRAAAPTPDTLTVIWVTTIATVLLCEVSAAGARLYVRFADPHAKLMHMFSAYLLLTAAIIGFFLILLTPVVVKRKRSNPPPAFVAAAFVIGGIPWIAMLLQAWE
jgi:membrane protein YdbS with pleckstrin-like domain